MSIDIIFSTDPIQQTEAESFAFLVDVLGVSEGEALALLAMRRGEFFDDAGGDIFGTIDEFPDAVLFIMNTAANTQSKISYADMGAGNGRSGQIHTYLTLRLASPSLQRAA